MSTRSSNNQDITANDAAIAQAIAKADLENSDAELARRLQNDNDSGSPVVRGFSPYPVGGVGNTHNTSHRSQNNNLSCPRGCGTQPFVVSPVQRVRCNVCGKVINTGERVHSCVRCDYDICNRCIDGRSGRQTTTTPSYRRSSTDDYDMWQQQPHMCYVPCVIGETVCVEMMVDSGASMSVISLPLARRVGLDSRIDRRQRGIASGVGQARIVGKIRNVICTLGHVQFDISFMVLDMSENILLMGLDQMRKFKCVIDLEKEVLVFGGRDGVEVPMLPRSEQRVDLRGSMGDIGCQIM